MSYRLETVLRSVERAGDSFAETASRTSDDRRQHFETLCALMRTGAELLRLEIKERGEPPRPTVVKEQLFGNIYLVQHWQHARHCIQKARLQKHEQLWIDTDHINQDIYKLRGLNPKTMRYVVFARRIDNGEKMAVLTAQAMAMGFTIFQAEDVF